MTVCVHNYISLVLCVCIKCLLSVHLGYKNEGWFDPWTLLMSLKKVAVHLGVHYLHGDVTNIGCHDNKVTSDDVSHHGNQMSFENQQECLLLGIIQIRYDYFKLQVCGKCCWCVGRTGIPNGGNRRHQST